MSSIPVKLEIGETVGDYEILSLLGRGGMGKVFKVRNVIHDRIEAMKVLLPDTDASPDLAERFAREIRLVASLEHPNIASLRTAVRIGNQTLMIMEFVDGTSLEQRLTTGTVDIARGVYITVQVLSALSYAHQHGVVHRDIKPSNILVQPNDRVKLTDFGIASRAGDPRITATGMALGSLYYMSPEQVKALPLDARSDIYSVGITLYEIVTGQRPIQGDSFFSIMRAHLEHRPVPPIEVMPGIPRELSLIIESALEKSPEYRFQSADQFRAALLKLYPTVGSGSQPAMAQSMNLADLPTGAIPHRHAAPSPSAQSFDPAVLETVRKNLATFIGPMAKVIVSRAAKQASGIQDLYEKVAAEIPSPSDRNKFLATRPRSS
jgi:serine/threonine-protein kinase